MNELIKAHHNRTRLILRVRGCIFALATVLSWLMQGGLASGQILITRDPRPRFEVATIKPSKADILGVRTRTYEGNFTAEHASLNSLLKFAYRIKSDDQIVGLPRWSEIDFFDVNAKFDEQVVGTIAKLPLDEMMRQTRLRVQSLLAERFHLSVTTRDENRKVYSLVISKNGPKLKGVESSLSVAAEAPRNGEIAPPPPGTEKPPRTPLDYSQSDRLIGRAASMDMLAQWLSTRQELGDRTVLNETGLGGRYDFSLTGISPTVTDATSQADEAQASVFTLIREQLGLQLQSKSAPIEVLVIETVAHPSAN